MASQRRKKEPKADLHVTVNPLIVEYFEALRPLHGREYSEFVEEKLMELISEFAPEKILEMQLEEAEKRVTDIKQSLIEIKCLRAIDLEKKKAVNEKVKLKEEEEIKLSAYRDSKYYNNIDNFRRYLKNPKQFQWDTLTQLFRFKHEYETQEYIFGRLKADGYTIEGVCNGQN